MKFITIEYDWASGDSGRAILRTASTRMLEPREKYSRTQTGAACTKYLKSGVNAKNRHLVKTEPPEPFSNIFSVHYLHTSFERFSTFFADLKRDDKTHIGWFVR